MKLYERSEFWALVGVVIGFLLSVIWEIIREKLSIRKKRKAIENELRTNLGLIPQKIEHLNNLKDSLNKQRLLPSQNVHCTTYLYDLYIGDAGSCLSEDERGNLNVIYESIKVVDKFLDNVFKEFIGFKASQQLPEPFKAYAGMCEELIERCHLIQDLIREYLCGKPRKIAWD